MFDSAPAATRGGAARLALVGALIAVAVLVSWGLVIPALVNANHGVPHGTILARGAFADATDVKIKAPIGGQQRVMNVTDSDDVIVQLVTVDPGAQTGWHSHPGPVVVVVKSGTMTLYQADDPSCTGRTFTAGDTFVDPGQGNVHNARNEGGIGVELYATYFDVPPGAGPAIPHPNPQTCIGF